MSVAADVIILNEVDSTMLEAARRARDLARPTWILGLNQTAARGRRGRAWGHNAGNFAATLVMPGVEARTAALRSFVAALALREVLDGLGATNLALKWPNDVLVNGGKVAGILLEMLPAQTLAIGIGINLVHAPRVGEVEAGAFPPVALGTDQGPEHVLTQLAPALAAWDAVLTTHGFEPVRDAWLAHAARLGEVIRARTVTEEHEGTFETIDKDGCLVLSTAKGRMTIPAADVYF